MKKSLLMLATVSLFSSSSYAVELLPPLSGGIGESGREIIQENQARYPLKLVLVGEAGVYLSDVKISVKDKTGKEVAETTTEGPIALIDVEPGTYTVSAVAEDITKEIKVTVGKTGLKTYHIRFPIKN